MTGAAGEEGRLATAVVRERPEEEQDRDMLWRRVQILLSVLGVVAALGLWWATATGRMGWPSSPPLPLPL